MDVHAVHVPTGGDMFWSYWMDKLGVKFLLALVDFNQQKLGMNIIRTRDEKETSYKMILGQFGLGIVEHHFTNKDCI